MPPPTKADTTLLLARLWERNLPLMRERQQLLEAAVRSALAGSLTEPEREASIDVAHKFAGSLGMFGYARGTDLARELEQSLTDRTLIPTRFQTLVQSLRDTIFPAA